MRGDYDLDWGHKYGMLRSGQIPNIFLKIVAAGFIERLDILKGRDESVILRYWLSFTIKGKIGHKADFVGGKLGFLLWIHLI